MQKIFIFSHICYKFEEINAHFEGSVICKFKTDNFS